MYRPLTLLTYWLTGSLMICSTAMADEFKPLTRSEPIVRMVLQEAAHEPFSGMVAVAGTALDRVADNRWPDTDHGVIYQAHQFTGMGLRLRNYSEEQITRARVAVEAARSGVRPCGRVLWYHTNYVKPKWDYTKIEVHCHIGAHIFYGDK